MPLKFKIHSSNIQTTRMSCIIKGHAWERCYRECMGPLNIIANCSANIQPNQTKGCRFTDHTKKKRSAFIRTKRLISDLYELFNFIFILKDVNV